MQAFPFIVFPLLAFALALGSVMAGLLTLASISSRMERAERWLPLILVAIAGSVLLANGLLNSRNLQYASMGANFVQADPSQTYIWISRLGSMIIVALCVPYFFAKLLLQKTDGRTTFSLPVLAIVFFGITNFLLPGLFGTVGGVDHRQFYPVLLMLVTYSSTSQDVWPVLRALKRFLFVFLVASLLFIAIDRTRVLAPGYQGWIPGLTSRFWGLAPHANAIGPMAALLVFLELLVGEKRFGLRLLVMTAGAAVLLLAQSKTAIGATFAGLLVIAYSRLGAATPSGKNARLHWGHGALLAAGTLGAALLLTLSFSGLLDQAIFMLEGSGATSTLQSISGRSVIWEAAYQEFLANPLFGYGPSIWDDDYRRGIGLSYAYHAHNQLMQSLAEAGLVGVAGLALFVATTIARSVRANGVTGGASVAILVLFLFRGFTEVPLHPSGVGTGEMFLALALMCIWQLGQTERHHTIHDLGGSQ